MKIGIILRELLVSGGGERQALMLAKEFIRRGHDVTVYATSYDKEKCFPLDVPLLPLNILPKNKLTEIRTRTLFLARFFASVRRESALARAITERIDPYTEVLCPSDNWGMRVGYYFKKKHPKVVSVVMLNDVFSARWTLMSDPLFGQKQPGGFGYFVNWLKDLLLIRDTRAQDFLAVPNDRLGKVVKKYFKVTSQTVRSGVDHERFKFIAHKPPNRGETIHLLSHAIFYLHRRFEDTINAVKILTDEGYKINLTVVGDYEHKKAAREYYQRLLALVERLHLQDVVTFAGRVSDADLVRYYAKADIFVTAAHLHTWGLVIFEALASGLPVVVSKTIGGAEILEGGKTAMLFNPFDPPSQATAIKKLISNPTLYERISREGNNFVRTRISWKRFAEDIMALVVKAREGRKK